MPDDRLHSPQSLRQDAERCFRLARNLSSQRDQNALTEFGRDLVQRAERMEAALNAAKDHEVAS